MVVLVDEYIIDYVDFVFIRDHAAFHLLALFRLEFFGKYVFELFLILLLCSTFNVSIELLCNLITITIVLLI